jgi:hypothetical protein
MTTASNETNKFICGYLTGNKENNITQITDAESIKVGTSNLVT